MDNTYHNFGKLMNSIYNTSDSQKFLKFCLENQTFPLRSVNDIRDECIEKNIHNIWDIINTDTDIVKKLEKGTLLDVCIFFCDLKKIEYCIKIIHLDENQTQIFRKELWNYKSIYFKNFLTYLCSGKISNLLYEEIKHYIHDFPLESNKDILKKLLCSEYIYKKDKKINHFYKRNDLLVFFDVCYLLIDSNYYKHIDFLTKTVLETNDISKILFVLETILLSNCDAYYLRFFMIRLYHYKLADQNNISFLKYYTPLLFWKNLLQELVSYTTYNNLTNTNTYINLINITPEITNKIDTILEYLFYEYDEQTIFSDMLLDEYDSLYSYFLTLPSASPMLKKLHKCYLEHYSEQNLYTNYYSDYNPYIDCARYGSFLNFKTIWDIQHPMRQQFLDDYVHYSSCFYINLNVFTASFFNKDIRILRYILENTAPIEQHITKTNLLDCLFVSIYVFFKNLKTWKNKKKAYKLLKQKTQIILSYNRTFIFSLYKCIVSICEYYSIINKYEITKINEKYYNNYILWFIKQWGKTYIPMHPVHEIIQTMKTDHIHIITRYSILTDLAKKYHIVNNVKRSIAQIMKKIHLNTHTSIHIVLQKTYIFFHLFNLENLYSLCTELENNALFTWEHISLAEMLQKKMGFLFISGLLNCSRQKEVNREKLVKCLHLILNNMEKYLKKSTFTNMKIYMLKETIQFNDSFLSDTLIRNGIPILEHFTLSKSRNGYNILKKWFPVFYMLKNMVHMRKKNKIYYAKQNLHYDLKRYHFLKNIEISNTNSFIEQSIESSDISNCNPEHISFNKCLELLHNDEPLYCTLKVDGKRSFLNISKNVYPVVKEAHLFKDIGAEAEYIRIHNKDVYFIYDFWDLDKNKRLPLMRTLYLLSKLRIFDNFVTFLDTIKEMRGTKFIYPKEIIPLQQIDKRFETLCSIYNKYELEKLYPCDGFILIDKNEKRWKLKPPEHMTIDLFVSFDTEQCTTRENIVIHNTELCFNYLKRCKYQSGVYRFYWKSNIAKWEIGEYRPEKQFPNPYKIVEFINTYHKNPFFLDTLKEYMEMRYYQNYELHSFTHPSKIHKIVGLGKLENYFKNGNILDLGCGYSIFDKVWKYIPIQHYTGIDYDYKVIKTAKSSTFQYKMLWGNKEKIETHIDSIKNTQHVVLLLDSLQHIINNTTYNECKYFLRNVGSSMVLSRSICIIRLLDSEKLELLWSKNMKHDSCYIINESYIKKIEKQCENSLFKMFVQYYFSWVHNHFKQEPVLDKYEFLIIMKKCGFQYIKEITIPVCKNYKSNELMNCYSTFVFKLDTYL